jgi:hypothetical protein
VVRLERVLKRTESNVERTKREIRNREVLANAKHEENKKQTGGKGAWHMKKCSSPIPLFLFFVLAWLR